MKETTLTLTGVIDTFLVLLIGIGPKIALVPFLQITAPLPAEVRGRVRRKMLMTAATAALVLVLFGEVLRILFHFSVGSLSIAGGLILLVLARRWCSNSTARTSGVRPDRTPCDWQSHRSRFRSCSTPWESSA